MDAVEFYIVQQIRDADTPQKRAAMLLRMPDAVLLEMGHDTMRVCATAGFLAGVRYLVVRLASLSAVRDAAGNVPAELLAELDSHRALVAAVARGEL